MEIGLLGWGIVLNIYTKIYNISIIPGSFRKNPPQSPFSKGEANDGYPALLRYYKNCSNK